MGTDALPYLLESLRVAATSIHSFIALICFVIAGIVLIVFRQGTHGTVTVLGTLTLCVAAIVFLAFSVTTGFSEPKRIYYSGEPDKDAGSDDALKKFHIGIFRKLDKDKCEDVPLKRDDTYHYSLKYQERSDGRFYLVDEKRNLRIEINTEERRIYYFEDQQRRLIYNIIVML